MKSRTAVIGGIPMRWIERGRGDEVPLVLIHGIPTSPRLWRHVMAKLRGVRCLAFEMVGYGESMEAGVGRDISVGRQADYLIDWLTHLGIERAVFCGHDLGGGVAHIAAVRHPQRCAGLFLTNAIGYDSWPIPSVKALKLTAPLVKHLPDIAAKQILRVLMIRGHDKLQIAEESLDVHWSAYERHGGAASLIRQVMALNVEDTESIAGALPGLNIPARVVWGTSDSFQKLRYGERFARDLNAPLHRIEGGLHFTPEDHPEIIAEQITRLLEDIERAA
ncbi:alpha/beta fold hydrolase [Allohahella sp. A8]|uniref:alpha/beta fold hydrolase n=1 Tax=Allohahella sp. A8 TaxID=3141461 RepID=UPI003A7F72AE